MEEFVFGAQEEVRGEVWLLVETTADAVGCDACGTRALGHGRRVVRAEFVEQVRATTAAGGLIPPVVVVLEGVARQGVDEDVADGIEVVHAPGDGDDTLVALASTAAEPVLLVSADKALGERRRAIGPEVVGPGWLLSRLLSSPSIVLPPRRSGSPVPSDWPRFMGRLQPPQVRMIRKRHVCATSVKPVPGSARHGTGRSRRLSSPVISRCVPLGCGQWLAGVAVEQQALGHLLGGSGRDRHITRRCGRPIGVSLAENDGNGRNNGEPERSTTSQPPSQPSILLTESFSAAHLDPTVWTPGGDPRGRIRPEAGVLTFDLRSPSAGFGSRQVTRPLLNATDITLRERIDSCQMRDQAGAGIALFFGTRAGARPVLTVSVNCGSGGATVQVRLSPEDNRGEASVHREPPIPIGQWLDIHIRRVNATDVSVVFAGNALTVQPGDDTRITQLEVGWFATEGAGAFVASLDELVVKGGA